MSVRIRNDKQGRKTTATIYGDLDHHTAKYIRSEIDRAIGEHNTKTLIIDFSNVTFMDSSGIGLVMGRYKLISELSGEVQIANPPPYIRKVIQLSGINKLCRIITLDCEDKPDDTEEKDTADKTIITKEQDHETENSQRA